MGFAWPLNAKTASTRKRPEGSTAFVRFNGGLNTYVAPLALQLGECSELVNWVITKNGIVKPRDVLTRCNSTTLGNSVVRLSYAIINNSFYTLAQTSDYKVYALDDNFSPTLLGTLSSKCRFVSFNNAAIILDGSYIKYVSDISSGIDIAYDDGTGTNGYQFNYLSGNQDSTLALGNGTNTRVATKFTSLSWDSGYTIPPTTVSAYLSAIGSPTGSITVSIRKTSDDTVIATKTFLSDVTVLTATATLFTSTFSSSDITSELSPSTSYYCSLEYSGGDASNYVNIHCSDVTSGGSAYYYSGSWTADTTKNCIMGLKPGTCPKASFGVVSDNRLWVAGDPDNPGYLWFGNLSYLDWSTPGGGGYISAIDSDRDTYEIGGIGTLYGDLIIYGTEEQPYMSRLTGSSPSDYSLELTFQSPWAVHDTVVNTANDLWAASSAGVKPVSGVADYGDLRTQSASDPIKDRIDDYWSSSSAMAAYYPKFGQYMLVLPSYHRVLVCHVDSKTVVDNIIRYPWTEYEFYLYDLTSSDYEWTSSTNPTLVATGLDEYYVTLSDGSNPNINTKPDAVLINGKLATEGTLGSLENYQWAYGDNNSLGYNTVYVGCVGGDPSAAGLDVKVVMIPQSIATIRGNVYMGGSDGYIYRLDEGYLDLGSIQIKPRLATAYAIIPFTTVNVFDIQLSATCNWGGSLDVSVFADGYLGIASTTVSFTLPIIDTLTVDEATMYVDDADFIIDPAGVDYFKYININAKSILIKIDNVVLRNGNFYLEGVILRYRTLER